MSGWTIKTIGRDMDTLKRRVAELEAIVAELRRELGLTDKKKAA